MVQPYVVFTTSLRRLAELNAPPFSTSQLIERCFPDTFVTGGTLPPGIESIGSRRADGPVIVYSRALSIPEQRFAVAHVLARVSANLDEAAADAFAAELLAPLAELGPLLTRRPSTDDDEDDRELYRDQLDEIAARFVVTTDVIESQIRRLEAA